MATDELIAEINKAVEEVEMAKDTADEQVPESDPKPEPESEPQSELQPESEPVVEPESVIEPESEPVVEPEPDDTPIPTPAPVTISDEALTRAVQVGIPLETARQFPNETALDGIVDAIERQTEETQIEEPTEPEDPFAKLTPLDPEVYEPEVLERFNQVMEIQKQQYEAQRQQDEIIQELQQQQRETSFAAQTAADREVKEWFDNQISELGDDFSEALGSGPYSSLSQGSSQAMNREKIAQQITVLHSGYEAMGQTPPSREELFDTATKLVLADEYQKRHEKKVAGNLEKRATQHIQRAGGQKASSTQTPEEEAAQAISEKFGISL